MTKAEIDDKFGVVVAPFLVKENIRIQSQKVRYLKGMPQAAE
jgi:hypothetical protein